MKKNLILTTTIIIVFAFSSVLTDIAIAPPDLPVIAIDPGISSYPPTATFVLNVTISGVTLENTGGYGICAWEVDINFNSTVLNAVSFAEGPWLKTGGKTTRKVSAKIDNSTNPGIVIVSYSLFPLTQPGALGSGTLCNITFQVMNNGRSVLFFTKTSLRAYTGSGYLVIDHTVTYGFFQYPQGPEGDADGDGDVDSADLADLQEAYGSTYPSPNWNAYCDFNRDRKVECVDLYTLGKHYGES